MLTIDCKIWGHTSGLGYGIVYGRCNMWQVYRPCSYRTTTEAPQHLFYCPVGTFCLSITLGVRSTSVICMDGLLSHQVLPYIAKELGVSICHNSVRRSMYASDILEQVLSSLVSTYIFVSSYKDNPLRTSISNG